jgi:cell division protein FtsZ
MFHFDLPTSNAQSIIKVIGVGGGGNNAVNHMFKQGIVGVEFMVCNTDNQALDKSEIPSKIQLGPNLTQGLGAGSTPEKGKQACLESLEELKQLLSDGTKMVFIAAGMGGGTGTGAAPIIAKLAKELGILTVGIVTTPFGFEGRKRTTQGMEGIDELRRNVDTLIVVSNDKLREIYGNLSISTAFSRADNVLATAAKAISEIITIPGYVNVDFADVDTVMRNSGVAIMGTATADGDDRAIQAVDEALNSPLLEDGSIVGARSILVNITYGKKEATMDEIFAITDFVQKEAGENAELIWGNCYSEAMNNELSVTVIATGFEAMTNGSSAKHSNMKTQSRVTLDEDDRSPFGKRESLYDVATKPTENSRTLDFNGGNLNSVSNFDRYQRNHYSKQEPFVKNDTQTLLDEERKKRILAESAARRERLRSLNVKMSSPQNVADLETVPAYMRRGYTLDSVSHSSEPTMSRWTISEDTEPQIRANNAYLHDNVD